MVMAASKNYITTLLLRLLLGAFEAGKSGIAYQNHVIHAFALGLAPGVVYYSTLYSSYIIYCFPFF